ncbi:hypothetical protein BASA82_000067 [Batrachochytrium salamandrivorans]|nr:hypothetical protein BASA82_000067 [Batrachochytrium salamandrivorans]
MEHRIALLLLLFNAVLFGFGCVVFGLSVNLSVVLSGWDSVMPATGSVVGLGIFLGLFMMLNGMLGGCCYPGTKARWMLCLNGFFTTLQFALLILLAYLLLLYSNTAWKQTQVRSHLQLDTAEQRDMNNAILSVFNKCCSGCDLANLALYTNNANSVCDNLVGEGDEDGKFCNSTLQLAHYPQSILCQVPGPCFGEQITDCWMYTGLTTRRFPPTSIAPSVCDMLQRTNSTSDRGSSALVGFPQAGGCGQGTVRKFVSEMTEHFAPSMYAAGVVCALFASLIVVELIVGLYCMARVRRRSRLALQEPIQFII